MKVKYPNQALFFENIGSVLNDSEQESLFRMISKGKDVGSLGKLEEILHLIESEILKELITKENVKRKEEDFVFNPQTGQDDWLNQLLNIDEADGGDDDEENEQTPEKEIQKVSEFLPTDNRLRTAESILRSAIEVLEELKINTSNVISK